MKNAKLMSLIALGFGLSTLATAQVTNIKKIDTGSTAGGGMKISVGGENISKPRVISSNSATLTILEFDGHLRVDRGTMNLKKNGVEWVKWGWFSAKPPRVRVVVKHSPNMSSTVAKISDSWTLVMGDTVANATPKSAIQAKVKEIEAVTGMSVPKLPFAGNTAPPIQPVNTNTVKKETETITAPKNVAPVLPMPIANTPINTSTTPKDEVPGKAPAVSLDFVATDIIQILKALSIQSNINIVAAPQVSPADKPTKLTVSLASVSLDEALSYVTAISSLRYAKVGNTYIVAPSEDFSNIVRQVMERTGNRSETRVVNLISGEAQKIRQATLSALPQDGTNGFYELIVPEGNVIPGMPAAAPTGDDKEKAPAAAPKKESNRAFYLVVVGDPGRVGAVESYIRDLDSKIAYSTSFNRNGDLKTVVVPVQSGETGRIKAMIDRLVAEHPRNAEFSVTETVLEGTTKGENHTMALIMFGPGEELSRLEEWAMSIDRDICGIMGKSYESDLVGLEKDWEVVDLYFVEPALIELELKSRFKGLQVSMMPLAVSPMMTGTTSFSEQNTGATGSGDGGQGASGDGGQESKSNSTTSEKSITGREPMRLVLRGTASQINEAKQFIALMDVAPKQVALELRVMELTKEEALKLGLNWDLLTGGRLTSIGVNQGLGNTSASPGTVNGGYDFNSTDSVSFLATLDKVNSGRNLIARPNALVTDGRSTNLFVGDTVRYIKTIQSTQNGTTVETAEINVGVLFNIAARVGGQGQISLALDQNFSILTGFTPVPGGGELPQTSDRRSTMHVNMKSGETIAIGGLILDQDRKNVSGIPLLKDLPIIGQLFSRTNNSRVRNEIVFFLTAVEVNENNRQMAASPGFSEKNNPDPLGDYQRSKGPKGSKAPLN
ncbi:MAG: hypothetical protein KDC26_04960 [Armatimonadetes bacterium]|nr:hypothetical protein [Armatimonadota bacterium]